MDYFEEVIENTPTNSLIQSFLEIEQIFDHTWKLLLWFLMKNSNH
jgi:hypothetical protein